MIDSHQHFWDPARGDYGWLQPGSALYRTFCPKDLAPLLEANAIRGSMLVQAAPTSGEADYFLDLAGPDAAERIRERAGEPPFVGVRSMLQDLAERDWILKPEVSSGIEAVEIPG